MALFPAWVPTDVLVVFLGALLTGALLLNRGKWWVINALAMDEPLVIAIGAAIIAASSPLANVVGGDPSVYIIAGAAVSLFGLYAIVSDRVDIDII